MSKQTKLYPEHVQAHAKIVDFAGWDMPLHYGSQLEEHFHVRKDAGMFDVSHMAVVDIKGSKAKEYLRYLLANDVEKLKTVGKALYSCLLNEKGGVLDDLIVYYLADDFYRIVVNAATCEKDIAWFKQHSAAYAVTIQPRRDLAILAIQGSKAREKAVGSLPPELQNPAKALQFFQAAVEGDWLVARTGYTGEDGFEVILPNEQVITFWRSLLNAGIKPCGLGARDTLRLEAGLNLYGTDMDETVTPLEANLAWTVAFNPETRDFIGRNALEVQKKSGIKQQLVGLLLEDRGVLRNHQKARAATGEGEITSGSFSPTLNNSIALARLPAGEISHCEIEVRGKWLKAKVVKPPFVRNGEILVK